jgi:hypothetical protein
MERGIIPAIGQRRGDRGRRGGAVVNDDAMNIAGPSDSIDQTLCGFDVVRIAVDISESRLYGAAEPHHTHPHFPQNVFPILLDAEIAVAKHGDDQRRY